MKICSRCKIQKSDSCFRVDKRNGSLNSWCNVCNKENSSKYYYEKIKPIKHPDKERPFVKEGFRLCLSCKKELSISTSFYAKGGNICKTCMNLSQMDRYWKNREKIKERTRIYREKNIERIRERAKKHREKINHSKYSATKGKEYRNEIRDSYVRLRLRGDGFKNEDITQEMIEAKKVSIVMERLKKALEKLGVKVCDSCRRQKPISEYYSKKYVWNGEEKTQLDNLCKPCRKERNKKYKHKKRKR